MRLNRTIELATNSINRIKRFIDLGAPKNVIRFESRILLRMAWSIWNRGETEYQSEQEGGPPMTTSIKDQIGDLSNYPGLDIQEDEDLVYITKDGELLGTICARAVNASTLKDLVISLWPKN